MKHLQGLAGALSAVENAIEGTSYEWLLRQDGTKYMANIYDNTTAVGFPSYSSTPAAALVYSLAAFQLRSNK